MFEGEGVAGEIDVLDIAVADAAGGAPGHEIAADEMVVGEDDAVATEDAVAAPAADAEDVALDAGAVGIGHGDRATGRVEIAVGDLKIAAAELDEPVSSAEAVGHAGAPALVRLLGRDVAAEDIGADADVAEVDVPSAGAGRVGGKERLVVGAVERDVLEAEGIRALDPRGGGHVDVGPEDVDEVFPLAAEDGEARDGERALRLIATAREEDDAAAGGSGFGEGGLDGGGVIGVAVTHGAEVADVEDGGGPRVRGDDGDRLLIAPG